MLTYSDAIAEPAPPPLTGRHWVRYGCAGNVGTFETSDRAIYRRGQRVVCRTERGLEIGEVLSLAGEDDGPLSLRERTPFAPQKATILRAVTVEDDLLLARLESRRDDAYAACVAALAERNIDATLIDVEHLFDGQTLFFYFLGEVTPAMADVAAELAEVYDTRAKFRQFTDVLTAGCGPGCGTDDAENGCGEKCGTCAVLDACRRK